MEELKKQCRIQIANLEKNLDEYENAGVSTNIDSKESSEETLQHSISRQLKQMKEMTDQMNEYSSTKIEFSVVSSFRSQLKDLNQRFTDLKKCSETKRWEKELLGKHLEHDTTVAGKLLEESKSLDTTLEIGRNVLQGTSDIRSNLASQKNIVESTGEKLIKFAEYLPGINTVVRNISARKQWNSVVIGVTIAVCCLLILAYMAYA